MPTKRGIDNEMRRNEKQTEIKSLKAMTHRNSNGRSYSGLRPPKGSDIAGSKKKEKKNKLDVGKQDEKTMKKSVQGTTTLLIVLVIWCF